MVLTCGDTADLAIARDACANTWSACGREARLCQQDLPSELSLPSAAKQQRLKKTISDGWVGNLGWLREWFIFYDRWSAIKVAW